jgi:predicted Fe-Mo cluster-binding NifX family protein
MKIIITASSDQIEGSFNPRFGRTEYFILIDSVTGKWEALTNPAQMTGGGAGPQAVQFIAAHKADVVISGRFGPNAFSALEVSGIKIYTAIADTVNGVLDQFSAGQLTQASEASGPGMHAGGRKHQ